MKGNYGTDYDENYYKTMNNKIIKSFIMLEESEITDNILSMWELKARRESMKFIAAFMEEYFSVIINWNRFIYILKDEINRNRLFKTSQYDRGIYFTPRGIFLLKEILNLFDEKDYSPHKLTIQEILKRKGVEHSKFHINIFEQIIQNLRRSSSTRCELSLQHKEMLKLIRNDFAEEGDLEEYEIFNVKFFKQESHNSDKTHRVEERSEIVKFLAVKIILLETYDYRDIVLYWNDEKEEFELFNYRGQSRNKKFAEEILEKLNIDLTNLCDVTYTDY